MSDQDLTPKERDEVAIQALIELIPSVGGALCTMYYGAKQERRFKRLESLYQELAQEIKQSGEKLPSIGQQDPAVFTAIMESLHDKVESEPIEDKRQLFKNYLKNTLRQPVPINYDEKKYFLDTLNRMTLLECELLALINNSAVALEVNSIQMPNIQKYAIVGGIGRLRSYGFIIVTPGGFNLGGGVDNSLLEIVQMSPYGRSFHDFCLKA